MVATPHATPSVEDRGGARADVVRERDHGVAREPRHEHAELVAAEPGGEASGSGDAEAASSVANASAARSPATWPCRSLIRLRPLTSTTTIPTDWPPVRLQRESLVEAVLEGPPVGEAGEVVGVGEPLDARDVLRLGDACPHLG